MTRLVFSMLLLTACLAPDLAAAYTSCREAHATCVARCKKDQAHDAACPSDHCDPKLAQCRADGCWQDGRWYAAAVTAT